MITVSNLSVVFTGHTLFDSVSFMIQQRDKVGLTGKNGAGKSTLLKIISKLAEPTGGSVSVPQGYRIGYLPQEMQHHVGRTIFEEAKTAFSEIIALEKEIEDISHELTIRTDYESDSYQKLIDRINEAGQQLAVFGSGSIEGETEKVLLGLGFKPTDLHRKMEEFSGGWKMRVELAKILLKMPDAILLDEPTNHLDIESIQWLENFLADYPGAVVMVSHDRAFLDAVTNRTIEITLGKIEDYKASWSRYVILRKERRDQQMAAYRNQQKAIEDTEKFIERFRYKASKAVQVQSRIKQLDKIDRLEVEEEDNSSIHFRFPDAPRSGKIVLRAENACKAYGEKDILQNLNFIVEREEKIAFVGRNGEGKTTLSKILCGKTDHTGVIEIGHNVKIGYYAQDQTDTLDPNLTVMGTLEAVAGTTTTQQLRNILGSFLFSGDSVDKKVRVLSGGEKGRLALARLLLQPVNLLILDEPTNHLDMRSKDILKEALRNYNGSMVLVSHDREFLDGLCNKVFEFSNKQIREYPGGIFEFLQSRKLETLKELEKKQVNTSKENKNTAEKNSSKPKRQEENQTQKNQNQIRKTEEKITSLEHKIKELEILLAEPELYKDTVKYNSLLSEFNLAQNQLNEEIINWENMQQ